MAVKNVRMAQFQNQMGPKDFTWIERLPFQLESPGLTVIRYLSGTYRKYEMYYVFAMNYVNVPLKQ